MSLKSKILLSCKDATLLTCKEQENAITLREKFQLRIHLLVCKFCALFYKQSNEVHKHLTKLHDSTTELPLLQLGDEQKVILQEKINSEL